MAAALERGQAVLAGVEEEGAEQVILTDIEDRFDDVWLRAPSSFMEKVEGMLRWYGTKPERALRAGFVLRGLRKEVLDEMVQERMHKGKVAKELAGLLETHRKQEELIQIRQLFESAREAPVIDR